MMTATIRKLVLEDMPVAARVHRLSFDQALPTLAGLHTPDEDLAFFYDQVFPACEMFGGFEDDALMGMIAFRAEWVDHLYVLPSAQGGGIGTALLDVAKGAFSILNLWTFQRNAPARAFYEQRGFALVELTDGSHNEEKEPDALYRWQRPVS